MAALLLFLVLLLTLMVPACGNFVSSLHSNFVVNLDFEGETQVQGDDAEEDTHIMSFAGGKQKFKCNLPTGRKSHIGGGNSTDSKKLKAHLMDAKLAAFKGRCWTRRVDYWSYDVCFGKRIKQYRPDAEASFSLGERTGKEPQLNPDGSVTELFAGGTDNRSAVLHYTCGLSGENRIFSIEEPKPLKYEITVTSAAFCDWRGQEGNETRDTHDKPLKVSALLEDLRGECVNVTQGWWTYEYCYPHSLTQFHLANSRREPQHTLGTLNGTTDPTDPGKVNMNMVKLKPSVTSRERRAAPSNHRTLRQFLGGGTVCDETNRARSTTMHFQCPPNWQTQLETRITNIKEGSLCEYEIMVQTPLICGHPKLLPSAPKSKEEAIRCVAQPSDVL